MTVAELVEKLMELDLDSQVDVWWYSEELVGEYRSDTPELVVTPGYVAICPPADKDHVTYVLTHYR